MVASQNGHIEVVDKLLQHGAKADLQKEVSVIKFYHRHNNTIHETQLICRMESVHCLWHLKMDMLRWLTSYYNMEQKQTYKERLVSFTTDIMYTTHEIQLTCRMEPVHCLRHLRTDMLRWLTS